MGASAYVIIYNYNFVEYYMCIIIFYINGFREQL